MRIRRLSRISFGLARHGLVVSAALAYWAIAVGVPLPVAPEKDVSVVFPCMHRSCGCHSAAGCKEHCCCFTDEQKLAWAAEHEVDPAPFVSDRAWRAIERQPVDGQSRLAAACCAREHAAPSAAIASAAIAPAAIAPAATTKCASSDFLSPLAPVLRGEGSGVRGAGAAAESTGRPGLLPPAAPTPSDAISISAYRQCHGFAPLWTLASASLPPPDPTRYEYPWELSGSVFTPASAASHISFTPPTPPPRG